MDPGSYPYVAGFYEQQVRKALGPEQADRMFRIYYQENSSHGAFLDPPPGRTATSLVATGGTLHQALLDLAAWAERGLEPLPSTRYRLDAMNQVVLPAQASERLGLQPVVHLTVDGAVRAEVGVNQPVNLIGKLEMPPRAGKIVEYDWYLGGSDFKFEAATKLAKPKTVATVNRAVSFQVPGEYIVALRATGERQGMSAAQTTTPLLNLDRVRVVVRGSGAA